MKCAICDKEMGKGNEFSEYIIFSRGTTTKDGFAICKNDMGLIERRLSEVKGKIGSAAGHIAWQEKEAGLLEKAKEICKKCGCSQLSDEEIDAMDDELYDNMCESCWERFRKVEDES